MAIVLNAETQKLIEERMKETGVQTADELVRVALQTLHQVRGEDFEDLDPETRAAIEEGLAQADRGEGRPWEEVREELRTRFIK
jgi:predicted transcriptional regulator